MKAGGEELRVLEESFNRPHCPDNSEPFSNLRALYNHVKQDHELKHLLFEEEGYVTYHIAAKERWKHQGPKSVPNTDKDDRPPP